MNSNEETCLLPSASALAAMSDAQGSGDEAGGIKDGPTAAIGVRSVGDTYFGETLFELATGIGSPALKVGAVEPCRVDPPPASLNESLAPLSTLTRKSIRRTPLWMWGLLAGGVAGLVVAVAFRSRVSSLEVAVTSEPTSSLSHKLEEASPSLASPTSDVSSVVGTKPENSALTEEMLRTLERRALLFQLAGECQKASEIYQLLAEGSSLPAKNGEKWRKFQRAASSSCSAVPADSLGAQEGGLP